MFIERRLNEYFVPAVGHSISCQNVLHNVEFGLMCSLWWFKSWYSSVVPLMSRRGPVHEYKR